MKSKHCEWCDNTFQTKVSYQKYCNAECREAATKEMIAEKYRLKRIKRRAGKERRCKSCNSLLSIYNDDSTCQSCEIEVDEVAKALKELKGIVNGKNK